MNIIRRGIARIKSWLTDYWLGMAEKDLQAMRDELAGLPRAAQLAILDAERAHKNNLRTIARHFQRKEIDLVYLVKKAEHDLDVMLDDIKPAAKVYDFRSQGAA